MILETKANLRYIKLYKNFLKFEYFIAYIWEVFSIDLKSLTIF